MRTLDGPKGPGPDPAGENHVIPGNQGRRSVERRRSQRHPSERLVAYTQLDEDGRPFQIGMAKTLNLSEGGVKLRIHRPLSVNGTVHMFMAVGEMLIEARGLVIHQCEEQEGQYHVGASFIDMEEKGRRYLTGAL
jgi:c-di-GMP-binding flagellar brake protein YcgR